MAGMFLESTVVADMTKPGLIETLRSTPDGDIPLLARHLRRLQASAQSLHYLCSLPEIEQALLALAHQTRGQTQRLRLLLHMDGRFELSHQPLREFSIKDAPPHLILAQTRLDATDIWLRHKTTHRPPYQRASIWLQSNPRYFDCLFLNQQGRLCEGSISNVYLQLEGAWYTPPLSCGVLPGILRETLLESGQVRERVLTLGDLAAAQSVRASNAVRGWLDVRVDKTWIRI